MVNEKLIKQNESTYCVDTFIHVSSSRYAPTQRPSPSPLAGWGHSGWATSPLVPSPSCLPFLFEQHKTRFIKDSLTMEHKSRSEQPASIHQMAEGTIIVTAYNCWKLLMFSNGIVIWMQSGESLVMLELSLLLLPFFATFLISFINPLYYLLSLDLRTINQMLLTPSLETLWTSLFMLNHHSV